MIICGVLSTCYQNLTLAIIDSAIENAEVFAAAADAFVTEFWIGGVRISNTGMGAADFNWFIRDELGNSSYAPLAYSNFNIGEVSVQFSHHKCHQ